MKPSFQPILSQFLRRAGLLPLADRLKFRIQQWRLRRKNRAFRQKHPEVALPPDYTMFESFRLDYHKYYYGGQETAHWLWNLLRPHLAEAAAGRILDWGCGPGRIVRHLPLLIGPEWEVYGTDYNAATIQWCRENLSGVSFHHNRVNPPLDFSDHHFDALYGISIFTHLSEANHPAWFQELLRVVKPGGVLLLTTHGAAFRGRLTPAEQIRFDQGKLVVRASVKEGHRLFGAFHSPVYLQNLFSQGAEVLQHLPGQPKEWGIEQDVWILRKKGGGNSFWFFDKSRDL